MRSDDDTLVELLTEALRRRERGESVDVEALCHEHPHLAAEVREALGLAPVVAGLAQPKDALIDSVLADRYRIDARLGAGAMGAVYAATDTELDRPVAIKVLHGLVASSEDGLERFQREAEVMATLRHPNLATVHDRGQQPDGTVYLVMELLDGRSLADLLHEAHERASEEKEWRRAVDWDYGEVSYVRLVARWCAALGRALATAHAAGVVHRDVKPSNVIVRTEGEPVLVDFGIAARDDRHRRAELTATRATLGTPWYMPPESLRGGHVVGPQVDVYGLGATLYHMLTLRPPYSGAAPEVFHTITQSDPPRADRIVPDLPRDLQAILDHAIARSPGDRYESVDAFADDLEAFLEHRPVRARPLSPIARGWRRARRYPARVSATVLAITATVLVAWIWSIWNANEIAAAEARADDVARTLPPMLGIESRGNRPDIPRDESLRAIHALERILASREDDLAARVLLGWTRLDRGEHEHATAAFRDIASRSESGYLRELAVRYASADRDRSGEAAVDLSRLPDPDTAAAEFVSAMHVMRARDDAEVGKRADALASPESSPVTRHMARIVGLVIGGDAETASDAAAEIEQSIGFDTATTRYVIGRAMVLRGEYRAAAEAFERSLELCPDQFGAVYNLAVAYRNLGELEDAEAYYVRAHAMRPWDWKSATGLIQIFRDRRDFERAHALLDSIPSDASQIEPWRIALERAHVIRQQIYTAGEATAEFAQRGFELYREAKRVAAEGVTKKDGAAARSADLGIAILEGLASEDASARLGAVLLHLAVEPKSREALRAAHVLIEEHELGVEERQLLAMFLIRLERALR